MRLSLAAVNVILSVVVWLPTWRKVLRTRSSGQYSIASWVIVFAMQIISLEIAVLDGSAALVLYFALNAAIVGYTTALLYRFRDR
jgi:energy-converting hydrogenase Eha subunit A